MNYFSGRLGLITKQDPTTENGGLFFLYYLVLKRIRNEKFTLDDLLIFLEKMRYARVRDGLYLRSSHHTDRTVSHDELGAMIMTSVLLECCYHQEILSYFIKNRFNYNATGKSKYYNPASFYPWFKLCNKSYAWIFMPLYVVNLLISSNKSKYNTSSKLIYFAELHLLGGFLNKYFTWRMKLMYGSNWINALFEIYFHNEDSDFPLIKLSKDL